MDFDSFPIGTFLFLSLVVFGLCVGISLLIMAHISDDKNTSVIKQVWRTFFGKTTSPHNISPQRDLGNDQHDNLQQDDRHDDLGKHDQQ